VLSNISLTGPANYWVVVEGYASAAGSFTLTTTCPVCIPIQGSVACGSNITGNRCTSHTHVPHTHSCASTHLCASCTHVPLKPPCASIAVPRARAHTHTHTHTHSATGGTYITGDPAPEHWYSFTAPSRSVYTFNTCGSSYDTWVHIYTAVRLVLSTRTVLGCFV
jgi:hypothetical protein